MLRVDVKYRRNLFNPVIIMALREALHEIAANALSVEEDESTHLTPSEVAVYPHGLESLERQPSMVAIYIDADFFESRRRDRERAEQEIRDKVAPLIPDGVTVSVWIRLVESGGFVEFRGTRPT